MKREEFNILNEVAYLDTAAGSLKPRSVIKAISDFYKYYPINPHSQDSEMGIIVANKIKESRILTAKLINGNTNEIIFTSGATDSLNKFAYMIQDHINQDDEIVMSYSNHASAIIPFIEMGKRRKAKVNISNDVLGSINIKTKLVIIPQESNSIGYQDSWLDIVAKTKAVGAILVNDAAQAILHQPVSLQEADVIAMSGNKLFGPTGTGVLAIKEKLLKTLSPKFYGGGAIAKIENDLSWKHKGYLGDFEAGTPNTAGIIGLGEAIKFLNEVITEGGWAEERALAKYAFSKLQEVPNIEIYSQKGDINIFFNIKGYNAQDIVSSLGHKKIILRSGKHCAHMTCNLIDLETTIRLSIAPYNNQADIDKTITALKGGDFLDFI